MVGIRKKKTAGLLPNIKLEACRFLQNKAPRKCVHPWPVEQGLNDAGMSFPVCLPSLLKQRENFASHT